MNLLIRLSGLWQWHHKNGTGLVRLFSNLTFVATLEMIGNISVHPRPVETLQQTFFCFENAIMPG